MSFRVRRKRVSMNRLHANRFFKLLLIAGMLASAVSAVWTPVWAQTGQGGWSVPANLSKSGQTLLSFITADSSGTLHAFWLDRLAGIQYAYSVEDGWSEPRKASFPVRSSDLTATDLPVLLMPKLIGGADNWVFFFWQDSGGLRYSSVNTSGGRTLSSWSNGGTVARSSASYDVVVDADGVIHVAYVQPGDSSGLPAGVYYLRSINSGANWTAPVLLYESPYFRNLVAESDTPLINNTVDLAVTTIGGEKAVYVAFDNQPRKRVFVTRSLDGGSNWDDAVEIDAPLPGAGLTAPMQIHVSARGEQALVAWQVKQSETVCFTYFRDSDDGGKTWNAGQRIYTPYPGCADQFDFLTGFDEFSMLLTSANGLTFLNAWNGEEWAGFQQQAQLSSFIDPETQDNVTFVPGGWTLTPQKQLAVVGNDRGLGGDAWVTIRPLEDVATWFAGEPGWKLTPELEKLAGDITDLQVVSDNAQGLHAFWVQKEIVEAEEGTLVAVEPGRVVYYSALENNRWTEPVQILRAPHITALPGESSRVDDVLNLTVACGPDDRLWAVWKNSVGGEIFASWARASAADSVMEWSKPAMIATIPISATDLSVTVDRGGWIHVIYVIPVNEGRGVYLVQSRDQGKTWGNAVLAFDGQAANWERVADPSLAAAADGSLWVLFSQQPVVNSELASGLFAIHSIDRGATWSGAETVSKERVLQSQVLAHPNRSLHRIWLEQTGSNEAMLFHQVSRDGGATWSRVTRISDASGSPGPAAATVDPAGQIHLVQILENQQQRLLLRYWLWNGSRWNVQEDFDLGSGRLNDMNQVGLGITPKGLLGAVASRAWVGSDAYQPDSLLMGLNRPVTLPEIAATPLPPLPTETATPPPAATETPAPTPTIDLATLHQGDPSTGGGTMGGLIIALAASVLVIGGGAGFAALRARKRNGR